MTTSRLESIPRTDLLRGTKIIVTGCGFRPVKQVFSHNEEETHDTIFVNSNKGISQKVNIGTAAAFVFAANGAMVEMVSRNESNLISIKENIEHFLNLPRGKIEYSGVDLMDEKSTQEFVDRLPKDKQIYWFNSIGLGAGSYQLPDGNPYLHIKDIPLELLEEETRTVLRGTHNLMTKLLPVFYEQRKNGVSENRIAIVSSMSAVRGYARGGAHCAAKGAISRYTNSAMLDLWRDNIFVTDIRPGAIDTGMYDSSLVRESVCEISDEYAGIWKNRTLTLAPPISVGYAALCAFTSHAHITSINLVAQGQFPNEGS